MFNDGGLLEEGRRFLIGVDQGFYRSPDLRIRTVLVQVAGTLLGRQLQD
jgi:hypothetical protein